MKTEKQVHEEQLINGCINEDPKAQELLYKHYYGYAMSVCLAYSSSRFEATEILNEGFLKVFSKIHTYRAGNSFQAWLRRTMVNTAIDYFRMNKKHRFNVEVNEAITEETDLNVIDELTAREILDLLQQLPENYRLTFNLYEIEGYSHEEISKILGIPEGTSRSNLTRAKQKLRQLLKKYHRPLYERYF